MPKKRKIPSYHILLLGDKNVGKYSLREQFIKGWIAPKDFKAPPGPASKTLVVDKNKIEITVSCLKDLHNPDETTTTCEGIIIVYNISEKTSLDFIRAQAMPFLQENFATERKADPSNGEDATDEQSNGFSVPLVLVGNKADEAKLSRNLSVEDGEKLSGDLKCVNFFETSATCNENVQKAFQCLVEKILERAAEQNPEEKKRPKSKCVIS